MAKRILFYTAYGLLLLGVTAFGLEFVASYMVPPWPAYEARAIEVSNQRMKEIKALAATPELVPSYNSWGFRDVERSIERPPNVRYRAAFVGDSFLEGVYVSSTLPARVERDWIDAGYRDMEAINLGISATGPPQYYYRTQEIALKLHPDIVVLTFYSGNDFVHERLSNWSLPPLITERPQPSLLGAVAPRFTWLTVNRLGLSEFARGNKPIPNEIDTLDEILKKPRAERVPLLVQFLKKYFFPNKSDAEIAEVLSRGGDAAWAELEGTGREREFLAAWWLAALVEDETGNRPLITSREEAERRFDPRELDATMTWLEGIERLVANKAKLLIVLAPVGTTDPRQVAFYKPWPRYYSWNVGRDVAHRHLAEALRAKGLRFLDLRDDLEGVRGAYHIVDGHWTELGTEIAAKRIADEVLAMRKSGSQKK